MKLRNKKTGKIVGLSIYGIRVATRTIEQPVFHSIRELNETFEDVSEEPKTIWYITHDGYVCSVNLNNNWTREKEIGNYFESKEEAEKTVERFKAWKRLKDKGLKITGYGKYVYDTKSTHHINIALDYVSDEDKKDLDLLFGEEE